MRSDFQAFLPPIFKTHLFNILLRRMPEIAFVFMAELAGGLVADCLHGANRSPATPCSNASLPLDLPPKPSQTNKHSKPYRPKGRLNVHPPKQASFQTASKTHSAAPSYKRSTNTRHSPQRYRPMLRHRPTAVLEAKPKRAAHHV